jgi:hypothetical protein
MCNITVSQLTDSNLLWSVVYISDTVCLCAGAVDNTLCARITAATLIQGARVDIHSRWYYRRCPLTTPINNLLTLVDYPEF